MRLFKTTIYFLWQFRIRRTMASKSREKLSFIDIGGNISDPVYRGVYRGKQAHEDDFMMMLNRAKDVGVKKIMITGTTLEESAKALEVAKLDDCLYTTVGCHPTRSNEFDESEGGADVYLQGLVDLVKGNRDTVVAVGECGLDYDRLQFSPKETQLKYFERQMELVTETQLPMFLHCRAAHDDFKVMVTRHRDNIPGGVVHSFDGNKEEAAALIDLGFYIGINGCSLKTQENIDSMCSIPTEKLMIETDCPYCDIRSTHAGFKHVKTKFEAKKKERFDPKLMVKSRNEPCTIIQVLEVMSAARQEDAEQLAEAMYNNTLKLFFGGKE